MKMIIYSDGMMGEGNTITKYSQTWGDSEVLGLPQQRPGIYLAVHFGLLVTDGQSLCYLPVCRVSAPTKNDDRQARLWLVRMKCNHMITERSVLHAVGTISEMFVETVSNATLSFTDINLRRSPRTGTDHTGHLVHDIFSRTSASQSTVTCATRSFPGATGRGL